MYVKQTVYVKQTANCQIGDQANQIEKNYSFS